ncbi:hypothetical protein H9P43_000100 [Blastocladiella emersonii ATCC 22665]|nr:hypothetical protein H9P43_000100 [Blastocladiella emersonii ATCC 22665]
MRECGYARSAFSRAAAHLSRAIDLARPLAVRASYRSFCGTGTCDDSLLGRAGASSFWARREPLDAGSNGTAAIMYPQALARQVAVGRDLAWSTYEIQAEFNADSPRGQARRKFWFPESGLAIAGDQYDFEYVVLHELVHGLGMMSAWGTYFDDDARGTALPLLTPPPGSYAALDVDDGGPVAATSPFAQPLLFDTLVFDVPRRRSLLASLAAIARTQPAAFPSTPPPTDPGVDAAAGLYMRATTARTFAVASDASGAHPLAVLETAFAPFAPGSSLSHVDQALYTGTRNALMRARASRGKTLGEVVDASDPLGPVVRGVLAALGYTVRSVGGASGAEMALRAEDENWTAQANPQALARPPDGAPWVLAATSAATVDARGTVAAMVVPLLALLAAVVV